MLSTLFDDYDFDPVEFEPVIYDKSRIDEIIEKIDKTRNGKIHYIGIYGQSAKEAFHHLISKFGEHILDTKDFHVVDNDDFVLCPIREEKYKEEDMQALSSLGASIIVFSGDYNEIYSHGHRLSSVQFEGLAYIAYANSLGWLVQDYVFAEMMCAIRKKSVISYDVILSNTNSKFVQSLIDIMGEPYFRELMDVFYEDSDINILCKIIENYDFNQIKDYPFNFVKRYIYRGTKT